MCNMDVIICFWDNEKNKVCSRYFDSNFLGHTSAQDILKSLQSLLTTLNPMGLIQLSMDDQVPIGNFLTSCLKNE